MRARLATLVLGIVLTTSCFSISHDYSGARQMTPGTVLKEPSVRVGDVHTSKRALFLLWGLIPLNSASAPETLEARATTTYGPEFDGITRVSIHEEQSALDVIVGILTLGIFHMISVDAGGEVHRFTSGGTP